MRSVEDLKDCQKDSEGISHFQLGNDQRSLWDLEYYQEGSGSIEDCQGGSRSILNCQMGRNEHSRLSESLVDSEESSIQPGVLMKMGSVDLMVYQGSSRNIPYLDQLEELTEQMRLSVGLINSEVSWIQPEELTEPVSSKLNLDQQMQLTEEDLSHVMIGGISIFLPFAPEEAENCISGATTTEE
jgi:hypothetical protein